MVMHSLTRLDPIHERREPRNTRNNFHMSSWCRWQNLRAHSLVSTARYRGMMLAENRKSDVIYTKSS